MSPHGGGFHGGGFRGGGWGLGFYGPYGYPFYPFGYDDYYYGGETNCYLVRQQIHTRHGWSGTNLRSSAATIHLIVPLYAKKNELIGPPANAGGRTESVKTFPLVCLSFCAAVHCAASY